MLPAIENLTNVLSSLPGIGAKSALRLALYLIDLPKEEMEKILGQIRDANMNVSKCPECHGYTEIIPCSLCREPYGEEGILCIVENSEDMFPLMNHLPKGSKFHVLSGKLSPLNGVTPASLNIENLLPRLKSDSIREIIIATGSDVEGETTAQFLKNILSEYGIRISRLAFGVSVGSSISASNERSIQKSISARINYA